MFRLWRCWRNVPGNNFEPRKNCRNGCKSWNWWNESWRRSQNCRLLKRLLWKKSKSYSIWSIGSRNNGYSIEPRLHIWSNIPCRKFKHTSSPCGILDDWTRNGLLRLRRQHGHSRRLCKTSFELGFNKMSGRFSFLWQTHSTRFNWKLKSSCKRKIYTH